MQQYKTVIVDPGKEAVEDPSTGAMILPDNLETWQMGSTWSHSTNILGLVIFSIATGIAIGKKMINRKNLFVSVRNSRNANVCLSVQHKFI